VWCVGLKKKERKEKVIKKKRKKEKKIPAPLNKMFFQNINTPHISLRVLLERTNEDGKNLIKNSSRPSQLS